VSRALVGHRVAVIMCADVVGYSRLMGIDEEGTLAALQAIRGDLVDVSIERHSGRIVRAMGDGLLVEFGSVIDAVRCAVAVQQAMPARVADAPADRRIRFRIAINMGDVVSDGDLIYGDGVNVAARMEGLAEPGGINVSRAVRDQVRDRLPVAFTDLGEHEVPNSPRPVRVFRVITDDAALPPAAADRHRSVLPPEKPAIAVLPFQNLGGDAEAEFFLDSVAEDLITELSRARWFSVVARNTSASYQGKGLDPKQLARDLGVRYAVEGSLRKAGARVRISCQLVEAASGQHLWADRFDGTLEDSFELQDKITESVIGSVAPVLRGAEIERARRKPEAGLDVYEITVRALPAAFAETEADNREALRLLDYGFGIDPSYPTANALAAWCHQQRHLMDWPALRVDEREEAKRLARRAISTGADVPLALAVAGAVRATLTRDHDLALAAVDRATMLNPTAAVVLGFDAITRCLCGDYRRSIENGEKALRLSPLEPLLYHAALAVALAFLLSGQPEAAVAPARRAIEGNRNFAFSYAVLALAYARLGQPAEAAQTIGRLMRTIPGFRLGALRRIRFSGAADLQSDLALLREAQLPE